MGDPKPDGWIKTEGSGVAPDPTSQRFEDTSWSLRYGLDPNMYAASVMDGYSVLLTHPEGEAILRRIRKALIKKTNS